MQGMELKFMTPTEVWEGFDACKAPLEASIISCQTTDNFVCEKQTFTADTSKEGRIRICCNVYYDARWQDARPAILLLPSFENPHSQDAVRLLVEEGFVTCALDFAEFSRTRKRHIRPIRVLHATPIAKRVLTTSKTRRATHRGSCGQKLQEER